MIIDIIIVWMLSKLNHDVVHSKDEVYEYVVNKYGIPVKYDGLQSMGRGMTGACGRHVQPRAARPSVFGPGSACTPWNSCTVTRVLVRERMWACAAERRVMINKVSVYL